MDERKGGHGCVQAALIAIVFAPRWPVGLASPLSITNKEIEAVESGQSFLFLLYLYQLCDLG